MAARNFPTFATDPLDSGSGTMDAKEIMALLASNANWILENGAVTVAHTGGGSANALETTTTPAITAYAADQTFWLVPTADNTGAVTIVRDGLASRAVVDKAGDALTGGELVSGNAYLMWDNGTHIRIMTPDAGSSGGASLEYPRIINADDCTGASYEIPDLGDYEEMIIKVSGADPSGTNVRYYVTCSDDNGSTYETVGYDDGETGFDIVSNNNFDNGTAFTFGLHIKRVGGLGVMMTSFSSISNATPLGMFFENGNKVNAIKLAPSTGTIGGTALLTMWAR